MPDYVEAAPGLLMPEKLRAERPDEAFSRAMSERIRRMNLPPGFNGLVAWGTPEAQFRQLQRAWADYDFKQSLGSLGGIA